MRYFLICFCVLASWLDGMAQQSPVYSQYIFNELVINPAYAGSHVQMSLTSMYRNQWVNLDGAPRTFSVSGHSSFLKERMGLGLMITSDQIGSYNNQSLFGSYAYILKTPVGKLSMGLQAGFNLVSVDFSDLNLEFQADGAFTGFTNKFRPNFGAGLYFHNDLYYAGISVPFLLNNSVTTNLIEGDFSSAIREARYYYIHGGVVLPLNATNTVKLNPGLLLRAQEGSPLSLDINAGVIFHEVFSIGASYRNIEGIVTYFDLKVSDQFHFGYSYDWTASDLNQFSNGTHEFMLNYRFRVRSVHGNIECPSYYQH